MEIKDNLFDALVWHDLHPDTLDEILTGCHVIGAEKVGMPEAEGLLLYLKDGAGKLLALYADAGQIGKPGHLDLQVGSVPY